MKYLYSSPPQSFTSPIFIHLKPLSFSSSHLSHSPLLTPLILNRHSLLLLFSLPPWVLSILLLGLCVRRLW